MAGAPLGYMILTCIIQAQCEKGPAWALRTVCPDLVHKVLLDRNEVVASASQNFGHLLPVVWGETQMAQSRAECPLQ